jgi:hypothetical protein
MTAGHPESSPRAAASLLVALTMLGLDHRLSWPEVAQLIELAQVDVERAIRDVAFDHWWNWHILATRRLMAIYEMLEPIVPLVKARAWRG